MLMSGLWNTCVWMLFASTLSFCSAKGSASCKSYPSWWLYSASTVPHQKLRKFHEAERSEWTIFHLWSTVKGQWPSLHSQVKTLHKAGSPLSFQWAWSTPDYFIGHNWTRVLTVVRGEWQTLTHTSYNAFQKCKAEWWHSSTKSKKKNTWQTLDDTICNTLTQPSQQDKACSTQTQQTSHWHRLQHQWDFIILLLTKNPHNVLMTKTATLTHSSLADTTS